MTKPNRSESSRIRPLIRAGRVGRWFLCAVSLLLVSASFLVNTAHGAANAVQTTSPEREEFFIISSVDVSKQQMVLKRPTEVTVLVQATNKSVYQDQQGKGVQLRDFKAGDTVYATLMRGGTMPRIERLRKSPMTQDELHRRYLKSLLPE